MNDAGDGSSLSFYRYDTDRQGVYTIPDGSTMYGWVDWFIRSSGVLYYDSSDQFKVSASNSYKAITIQYADGNGALSANGVVVDAGSPSALFYMSPSQASQYINIRAVSSSGGSNPIHYYLSVQDLGNPSYTFLEASRVINEGQSAGLLLQTTGLPTGALVQYTVSGISASRLTSGSATGSTTVDNNGQALINLGVLANNHTDGPTTAAVSVANGAATYSVLVNDTSTTPVAPVTYSITGDHTVNEGSTDYLQIQTTGLASGSVINYTISGIEGSRVSAIGYALPTGFTPSSPVTSLNNYVTVNDSGHASISLQILNNNHTDGATTAVVSIANGAATYSVLVHDTSTTPTTSPNTNSSNQTIEGSAGQDTLYGADGSDLLNTYAGNDLVYGFGGDDTVDAGYGFDTVYGGMGNDYIQGGFNGDQLYGEDGNDDLRGGNGLDLIVGGAGNDTIRGAKGTDTLTGGDGADVFVFEKEIDGVINVDTITDFVSGTDRIELSASVFGNAGAVGSHIGLNQFIKYNASTGVLSYDADGSGPGAGLAFAVLGTTSHPASVGTDFWITG